jgi:hypothetical protein
MSILIRDPLNNATVLMNVPLPSHFNHSQRERVETVAYAFVGILNELRASDRYDEVVEAVVPAMHRVLDTIIEGAP